MAIFICLGYWGSEPENKKEVTAYVEGNFDFRCLGYYSFKRVSGCTLEKEGVQKSIAIDTM